MGVVEHPRLPIAALVAALVVLVVATAARAGYVPGGEVPAACSGPFGDLIGTLGDDALAGDARPQRLYGLTGADWLVGSATRASCLFGGQGDDVLGLGAGGGVALGELGMDVIAGSSAHDALSGGDGHDTLSGGEGDDVLRGGRGLDGFDGGSGDDLVDAADGRAELVVCGDGHDVAIADAVDVTAGCESRRGDGPPLPRGRLIAERGLARPTFRLRFVAPEAARAGGYRILLAGRDCWEGLREAARWPAAGGKLRRGQVTRIGLRPPAGGWCRGAYAGAVVRARDCPRPCAAPLPVQPLALLTFTVR